MNPKHLTNTIILIFVSAFLLGVGPFLLYKKQEKIDNTIQNIKISPKILAPEKSLEELIENLPDGSFKSNLMVILGADLNGDSDQLNEILRAYAQMKINEMKKQNQL